MFVIPALVRWKLDQKFKVVLILRKSEGSRGYVTPCLQISK